VILRLLLGTIFLAVLSGCATTGPKSPHEQLQSRVTDLEKKVEEKDSEIVDLQYQVKDLSSKVSDKSPASSESSDEESTSRVAVKAGSDEIIRVNAPVEDVQKALKNAGFYSGKIDGKAGAGTKTAIVAFQKSHHLAADGVLGKKTWKLLKSYLKE
jgi:peptidoglycan hydrolase-like protein with peptidoglycan-binding domain